MSTKRKTAAIICAAGVGLGVFSLAPHAAGRWRGPMTVDIDATELPRKLLLARVTIPLRGPVSRDGGELALWFPKWVPGIHGPGGPVQNIAGLVVADGGGDRLSWAREPGEIHRVNVDVPAGTRRVVLDVRYVTNQPSTNSSGADSFGSELLGFVSPNTVLLYPDGAKASELRVEASLALPDDWSAVTALRAKEGSTARVDADDEPGRVSYETVTLETFVDSPIMMGRHVKGHDLVVDEIAESTPPHLMSVFSEAQSVVDVPDDVVELYRNMVTQATLLFGDHPFERFDVLVATTDSLGRNGLEHLASSFNVIPQRALRSVKALKGWDELLIPHEYVHAWCGKDRRPVGMITPDFHAPKDTGLLWVYEGLTQHLGLLLQVRSGMMTEEEFLWELQRSVRNQRLRQGREWRPLADTCAASHSLRARSSSWGHLRRSQDYYFEGALIWLEVDAVIRRVTNGVASLDDFVRRFFRQEPGEPSPRGFTRDDVVAALSAVAEHDWETFLRERIDEPSNRLVSRVAQELGYDVQFGNELPEGPGDEKYDELDMRDSLGASFSADGTVRTVQLRTPADAAGLGPGMKVAGIDDYVWTKERLVDAVARSADTGTIDLLVISGEKLVRKPVAYDGGPRFMVLVRRDDGADGLADILKPLEP